MMINNNAHEGFKQLVIPITNRNFLNFNASIYAKDPVHSKLIWLKDNTPIEAYTGSANYTQAGFSTGRRNIWFPAT